MAASLVRRDWLHLWCAVKLKLFMRILSNSSQRLVHVMSVVAGNHVQAGFVGLLLGHVFTVAYDHMFGGQVHYHIPAHELDSIVNRAIEKGQRELCCSASGVSGSLGPSRPARHDSAWELLWALLGGWKAVALCAIFACFGLFFCGGFFGKLITKCVACLPYYVGSSADRTSPAITPNTSLQSEALQQLALVRGRKHGGHQPKNLVAV